MSVLEAKGTQKIVIGLEEICMFLANFKNYKIKKIEYKFFAQVDSTYRNFTCESYAGNLLQVLLLISFDPKLLILLHDETNFCARSKRLKKW